jgi:hypothetical protein
MARLNKQAAFVAANPDATFGTGATRTRKARSGNTRRK